MKTKKFCLTEKQMPTQWYNIVADMPNKPLPPLHTYQLGEVRVYDAQGRLDADNTGPMVE
jgi:predicted alternative tryptophan synthase beta-subunit